MSRHVVDTNVLIVASSEHSDSPFASDKQPVEDMEQAEVVFSWLEEFEASNTPMVVDYNHRILGEYQNKLTEQDYGLMVVRDKQTNNQVDYVALEWEDDPQHPDPVAVLEEPLKTTVHDLADRKMVAACLKANEDESEHNPCTIVNACDTDWYEWQSDLEAAGVEVEQLIPDWCHQRFEDKQAKKRQKEK